MKQRSLKTLEVARASPRATKDAGGARVDG
jgi:hypothetical protein